MKEYLKTERTFRSKIKRKLIGLLPRRFHCYCLGAEKTGTTSIYSMFKNNYRSSHEADPRATTALVLDYLKGNLKKAEVAEILKRRDQLLNLEMESAHHLVYVAEILAEEFNDAKFIITIREPYSHLESRLNWHLTPNHPAWDEYVKYFFVDRHTGFEREEMPLKKYNLYSLDTFLKQYSEHYKFIFQFIPEDRRIFIKTSDLGNSTVKIADFLDIDVNSIQFAHSNKRSKKVPILNQLEESFVRKKIWESCSEIIKEFYPETTHLYNK